MSSEEISTVRRCPTCGAEIRLAAGKECCLCQEETAIRAGTPEQALRDRELAERIKLPDRETSVNPMAAVGVLAIILCVWAVLVAPGVLVVILTIAAPIMIGTVGHAADRKPDDRPMTWPAFIGVCLSSLGLIAIVVVTSFAAFAATCFALFAGLAGSMNSALIGYGIVFGLVAGFGILLIRNFWPKD